MDDEQRQKLVEQMDQDLDDFIRERSEAYRQEKESESPKPEQTLDELVAELKTHPAFMTDFDPSAKLSPAMEGLQKLKYESESANYNAQSYKEDGNHNFKLKKYRWACDSYAQGIKEKADIKELNAVLYSNRAAAQFHLGNNRSALNDVIMARKFKPDHIKAIFKGAQCCVELRAYKDALRWCDDALVLAPTDAKVLELRVRAQKLMKEQERDKRRENAKERKQKLDEQELLKLIQDRGVKVVAGLDSPHPSGARVHVHSDLTLNWPVLFVYPECGQTDFIEAFSEHSCFSGHLDVMFGHQVEPPAWDEDKKYKPEDIDIYFQEQESEKLFEVEKNNTLLDVLKHERFVVHGGTPTFILLARGSPFANTYVSKYLS